MCSIALQIAAILLATGGAVLSLMNFDNSFSNRHQRVGLVLYGFMWLQPIIGFFRPERKNYDFFSFCILQHFQFYLNN
jgi:hypothetical protein